MTLPGGQKLVCIGSYRMTGRRLGRGNFAKVEEAVHTVLKTKVALKIMNVSEIKEEYVVRNLHREARLMSRLSHPCIVTLFETMQNGPVYYLVTELIGGGDLCSFIKSQRCGKLEEKSTKLFGRQLVSAVAYMHSLGIVHRDLKMENIMLNESKTMVKIVDFGLSNMFSGDSMLRTHCGSPEYAAPELFVTGQMYGPQVDLWSLGVILYGMVMGHLPFVTSRDSRISSQERRKHLLSQINRGLGPNHRKSLANFTVEFRSMINRLLLPDPQKRISIMELVRHPWLTDRNRRPLRIHGMKELEHSWKSIINKDIAKLLNLDLSHVEYTLRAEPFGFLAGMYNILAHRRIQQQESNIKESLQTMPQRPATTTVTSPTNKSKIIRHASCCEYDFVSERESLPIKKLSEMRHSSDVQPIGAQSPLRIVGTKTITKSNNTRPNTENKKVNTSTQRAASSKTTPPTTTATTEAVITKRRTRSEPLNQQQQQQGANSRSPSTNMNHVNHVNEVNQNNASTTLKRRSEQQPQSRPVATSSRKPNTCTYTTGTSRSQPSNNSATTTTQNCRAVSADKAVRSRHRENSGNATGASSEKATRHSNVSGGNAIPKRPCSTPAESGRRCNIGDGDGGSGTSCNAKHPNSKVNRRLLNEPIARCIAGYVDKYMNVRGAKVDQKFCNIQAYRHCDTQQCQVAFLRKHSQFRKTYGQECEALVN